MTGYSISELHWQLVRGNDGLKLSTEGTLGRARRVEFLGDRVLFPEWADLLVYLAVHASNHGWERLEQLACLAAIVRQRPAGDQAALLRVAADRGALRRMRVAVLLTGDFLGVAWDPGVLAGARADRGAARVAPAAARVWQQGLEDERTGITRSHGRVGPALLRMTSQDGPAAQARYAALLALEPDELDWAVVDLPPRLEPLYYLVRPYRLARLYGGRAVAAATRLVRRG